MSIDVTILGSSAMFATAERACSGYLLEYGGARVWMDAGGGTWRNLLSHIAYPEIDGILLSHRHPDHTIDVFQAFHARMYGGLKPLEHIPVWAPQETIDRLIQFYPGSLGDSFVFNPVGEGHEVDVSGAKVSFVRMAHPPETLGMRVEFEGSVAAYTADTGPAADFKKLASDCDLLICEATFQETDKRWEGHMTAAQAGEAAAEVGAQKLLLTHLPHDRDLDLSLAEAGGTAGDVRVSLAADGDRYSL